MSNIRYNRNQRDANEQALLDLAERLGGCWREGPPLDGLLWVPRLAKWQIVEIKMPHREGWASEYTNAQKQFIIWCERNRAPYWVWRTEHDVLRDLQAA